jgi:hypothetical protein
LCKTFIVDAVGYWEGGGFKFYASGKQGTRFRPSLPLVAHPWFRDFRESQQNFSLGVREISPPFIREFERLAKQFGEVV